MADISMTHPDIPGSLTPVSQAAFDAAWAPLGWLVAVAEKPAGTTPLKDRT